MICFAIFSYLNVYAEETNCTNSAGPSSVITFVTGTDETIDNLVFCNSCSDNEIDLPLPKYGISNKQFKGWYTGENGAGVKIEKTTDVLPESVEPVERFNCNEEVYKVFAFWETTECVPSLGGLMRYNVVFDSKGGSYIETMTRLSSCISDHGELCGNDSADINDYNFKEPIKEGYEFDGWYSDEKYSKKVTNLVKDYDFLHYEVIYNLRGCSDSEKSHATVYAKWKLPSSTQSREVVKVEDTGFYENRWIYVFAFSTLILGSCCISILIRDDNKKSNED